MLSILAIYNINNLPQSSKMLIKSSKNCQTLLKFCQSVEISLILVTLSAYLKWLCDCWNCPNSSLHKFSLQKAAKNLFIPNFVEFCWMATAHHHHPHFYVDVFRWKLWKLLLLRQEMYAHILSLFVCLSTYWSRYLSSYCYLLFVCTFTNATLRLYVLASAI